MTPADAPDFFATGYGWSSGRVRRRLAPLADPMFDLSLALSPRLRSLRREAAQMPVQNVLVAGVEVPSRAGDIHAVVQRLRDRSRHQIDVSIVEMADRGKFQNLNEAIARAPRPLGDYDWLVITDDDIAFPAGFLDLYLSIAAKARLVLSQPAHAFHSHASYVLTLRRWNALARRTRFVEIGPINFIAAKGFAELVPFPSTRWGWGVDPVWSAIAERHDWPIGIVDALPIRHLRPVAASYDGGAAREEGDALMRAEGVTATRRELLGPSETVVRAF